MPFKEKSNSIIKEILLYAVSVAMIVTFSICQKRNHADHPVTKSVQVEVVGQSGKNEMSAIKFTALPFILAFKHFIVEREE